MAKAKHGEKSAASKWRNEMAKYGEIMAKINNQ
jgi:hypothetical protein